MRASKAGLKTFAQDRTVTSQPDQTVAAGTELKVNVWAANGWAVSVTPFKLSLLTPFAPLQTLDVKPITAAEAAIDTVAITTDAAMRVRKCLVLTMSFRKRAKRRSEKPGPTKGLASFMQTRDHPQIGHAFL